jgi:molecular chaperone DnaJ
MDLYSVLDLLPAATPADIERAYLRLARRYHPGINPGDRLAAERFLQVQGAYDVLGDPVRRQQYDQGLHPGTGVTVEATIAFEGFDFSATAQGADAATFSEMFADVFHDAARRAIAPDRGASLELTMQVSFEEAMRGAEVPVSVVRQERCPGCSGAGLVDVSPMACPACGGQGAARWARGHMVFTKACDRCGGSGQMTSVSCRVCGSSGVQARSEVVTVHLPPGLETDARLVVPGRGHAGSRGGPAGDLYVTIEVQPHPVLRREGRDLHVTVPVAIHEAALGARIEVPSLDGPVGVRVPPGTAAGTRLRVKGKGVPAADGAKAGGDLWVEVQLVLPPVQDERSKALLREFGRLNPANVRAHLFS